MDEQTKTADFAPEQARPETSAPRSATVAAQTLWAPEPDSHGKSNIYARMYRADLARIPDGPEKNYLLDRVFPQMTYYSKNAYSCMKTYYCLTILCIILNGVIPLVILFEDITCVAPYVKLIVTALSSAAGILTAVTTLKKHSELGIQYRMCLDQLKHAVSMYFLGTGDFEQAEDSKDRIRILFNLCENVISTADDQVTELLKEKPDQ